MKPNKQTHCNCINCNRSCYRGKSGTVRKHTSREETLKRLADLKALIAGGQA